MTKTIKLINGECIEKMKQIPDGCVDLVCCDPPYGTTQCKWDSVIPFEEMWKELKRVGKPNSAYVFMASQPFTSSLIMSNLSSYRQTLVWEKNKPTGHLNAKRRHMTSHEDIVIFSDKPHTYNPQMWQSKPSNSATRRKPSSVYGAHGVSEYKSGNTKRYPKSVLKFDVVNNDGSKGGRFHPSQKPLELISYLIRTFSNNGDTVLDFTMGSGTTGVAALIEGRSFIGIEMDFEFFSISRHRIENELSIRKTPTITSRSSS